MRTLKNVTTRNKKRKSSPSKMVCTIEIADNLTLKAESTSTTSSGANSPNDIMKMPPSNEMYLLNIQCEKSIAEEVQFYFKSYEEFISCKNDRMKTVISALNFANVGHYNDLRIKCPGFMLELPLIDINKVVQVIQCAYPSQVIQYSLDIQKKNEKGETKELDASTAGNKDGNNVGLFPPKGKDQVGLFPTNSSPKNHNKSSEHFRILI